MFACRKFGDKSELPLLGEEVLCPSVPSERLGCGEVSLVNDVSVLTDHLQCSLTADQSVDLEALPVTGTETDKILLKTSEGEKVEDDCLVTDPSPCVVMEEEDNSLPPMG